MYTSTFDDSRVISHYPVIVIGAGLAGLGGKLGIFG